MKEILKMIFDGKPLSREIASQAMERIMSGEEPPERVAAFLGALRARNATVKAMPGEIVEELVGFAQVIRKRALPVPTSRTDLANLIDTCGTGGDASGTFNISTACALVVSGAGVGVAKHGNRSVSSQCGSADVLEALGVKTDLPPEAVGKMIDETGFGFLYVPVFHPALKSVAAVRRAIGVPTVFNLLGPLANPAGVKRQVMGIYDPRLLTVIAETLQALGAEEVMVVHADVGLDEFSLTGETQVAHLKNGQKGGTITRYSVTPGDAGLPEAALAALKGGDAPENARTIERILGGEKGPKRDSVLMNSAASLIVAGRASDLKEGMLIAAESIDSGKGLEVLRKLRAFRC